MTSGILHWLLSQSIFLVRLDGRTRGGELYPAYQGSTCACGYSSISLLCFALVLLVLLFAILLVVLRRSFAVRIPPAQHCSAVISAACHPPLDDTEAYTKKVQWGVVKNTEGTLPEHCTFTSQEVTPPKDGMPYA